MHLFFFYLLECRIFSFYIPLIISSWLRSIEKSYRQRSAAVASKSVLHSLCQNIHTRDSRLNSREYLMQRFMKFPRIPVSLYTTPWESKYTIRDRARSRGEKEKEREVKDNNVFDEEWHYSRGRRPSRYELHWRLKLVRDGKKKRRKKGRKGEKKKRKQERRPRAVGGAGICILNGLGFITVGLVLAIYVINKERSLRTN